MANGVTIIFIEPEVYSKLNFWTSKTNLEISGFGWIERMPNGHFLVKDAVLLDKFSYGFTEIDPDDVVKLHNERDTKNMRLWWHRHPVGDGNPGDHNWSQTDIKTIKTTPIGNPAPQTLVWSASIVLTPQGWVGRLDNYLKEVTVHCPVMPYIAEIVDAMDQWDSAHQRYLKHEADAAKWRAKTYPRIPQAKQTVWDKFRSKFGSHLTKREVQELKEFYPWPEEEIRQEFEYYVETYGLSREQALEYMKQELDDDVLERSYWNQGSYWDNGMSFESIADNDMIGLIERGWEEDRLVEAYRELRAAGSSYYSAIAALENVKNKW